LEVRQPDGAHPALSGGGVELSEFISDGREEIFFLPRKKAQSDFLPDQECS